MQDSEAPDGETTAEKLTPKQQAAITALLTNTTVEAAAKAANVNPSTLYRWMKDETFKEAWQRERLGILDAATMKLRQAADDAVETLKRNLLCGNANTEIRAAGMILEMAYKSAEVEELAARIENLEEFLQDKDAAGSGIGGGRLR